ncbi:hypothetical protein R6Q57_029127 [Mikania cordata]
MFSGGLSHAPNSTALFGSSSLTPSPPSSPASYSSKFNRTIRLSMASSVRIVVVGDVHDDWDLQEDSKALELLQPDLVLFTGDFGNENIELVRSIAALKIAKAAILGNHDAWNTHIFSEKHKDAVQIQLESFGEEHVGYKRLDFHPLKLSVIGGRPFSCGGLGSNMNDICGRDWVHGGGDHGDPDLALAISQLKGNTKYYVPLVVFGHMHKRLAFGDGSRNMIVVGDDNTIFLNGAVVPRVKRFGDNPLTGEPKHTLRAFTLIDSKEGKVDKIAEAWVSVIGDNTSVKEEHILYSSNMLNTSHI